MILMILILRCRVLDHASREALCKRSIRYPTEYSIRAGRLALDTVE